MREYIQVKSLTDALIARRLLLRVLIVRRIWKLINESLYARDLKDFRETYQWKSYDIRVNQVCESGAKTSHNDRGIK